MKLKTTTAKPYNSLKLKKILVASFLVAVGAIGIWYLFRSPSPLPHSEKIVEIEVVGKMPLQQTIELLGTIKSAQQTTIVANEKGRLDILVAPGTFVAKDQLIARIDNPSLARTYELSKQTQELSQKQLERAESLLAAGFASKKMIEDKKSAFLEAQKKRLDTKIALEQLQIRAPFDGVVGLFKKRDGSQISQGDVISNFYNPRSTIVEFEVPLAVSQNLKDGDPIIINGISYPLTHIQKMLDEDTHMCPAYVALKGTEGIIGTTIPIKVIAQNQDSVIAIPYEALFMREGKFFVYLLRDNKVVLAPVELGIREKELIEITNGLSEGDQLIVQGHGRLSPEEKVQVRLETTPPSPQVQIS